ncbi:hypothetical protein A7D16_17825 [Xanthomonas nasturtii]|uniref:hypothetical protein n=1 Tax=Xanthomonas nasturtii TaxID=1843581 RepID=UPI0007E31397|nr:hypothetical protein [Xanthomonas nasturtii]OAX86870.1 hypothetical protein A7D16_17825 [Xanthomonas nasturtii]WVL56228.1 hypothetical protein M3O54_018075 [Xanthomonas nasturtii]
MPSLICDLEDLLASWKAEARTFDACDMPASALAFRDCHRRLSALLDEHACHTTAPTAELAAQSSVTRLQAHDIAPLGS